METIIYADAPLSRTRSLVSRKIVRVSPVGKRQMYDIEVSNPKHNFCLPNGIITSNSHSVCYAIVAYSCAYLKKHFPLEWWCAVLSNANKNEIAEKFWRHCKAFCSFPDLTRSSAEFEIQGDKIVAPISILQGVGEGAHKELEANKPYKDIEDFCVKIFEHKKKNAKVNEEGKVRAGHSALDQGVVSKLIVSGVMDSLFPKGMNVIGKLELYQLAMAKTHNQKPKPIHKSYSDLNSLRIFQFRKAILPIHSEPLLEQVYRLGLDGVTKIAYDVRGQKHDGYTYRPADPIKLGELLKQMEVSTLKDSFPFVPGTFVKEFNTKDDIIDPYEKKTFRIAAVGYVSDYKEFTFGGDKRAAKVVLDIDGEQMEFVRWPSRKTGKLIIPNNNLKGSVVIAVLSRWNNHKPFTLDAIIPIQEALEE